MPMIDSLHGSSTPAQMNTYIDTLLATGQDAFSHDQSLTNMLGVIVASACLLSLIGARSYARWMRKGKHIGSERWRTALVTGLLAIVPVALAFGVKLREDTFLNTPYVVRAFSNSNTSPQVASPGTKVWLDIPVSMQSFYGYYEVNAISISNSYANLSNGSRIPVELGKPEIWKKENKPNATDFITVMENVVLRAAFAVPADPQLKGALIAFSASGNLSIIPQGRGTTMYPRPFQTSTTFRVARDNEVQFAKDVDGLTSRLLLYVVVSLVAAILVAIIIIRKPTSTVQAT